MEKRIYEVRGMSCAACASKVERAVKKLQGIKDVNVMLLQGRMTLIADESSLKPGMVENAVHNAGYEASLSGENSSLKRADGSAVRLDLIRLCISVLLTLCIMLVSMGHYIGVNLIGNALINASVQLMLTLYVGMLQFKYFYSAFKALRHMTFNMDTLVAMGALVSIIYSLVSMSFLEDGMLSEVLHQDHPVYFESAAAILTFVAIGKYLEGRARIRTTDAVAKLYDLAPKFVRVKRGGSKTESLVPLSEVAKDDVVVLKSGDQVGIDGTVILGNGHTDESALTGESVPVKKKSGSKIMSSSVLLDGYLEVRAESVGEQTTLSKIIELVNDVTSRKVPAARFADQVASWFVPVVIVLAVLVFIIWHLVLGESFSLALEFAISVLVVSCPCALGLATPVAIMAGTGKAAVSGILFKSPETIEELQRSDIFVFDKTGTLTYGNLTVNSVISEDRELAAMNTVMAASLEQNSSHPLASAITRYAKGMNLFPVSDYRYLEGKGVMGRIGGTLYAVGNEEMAPLMGVSLGQRLSEFDTWQNLGKTVLALYKEGSVEALFVIGDELKPGAIPLLKKLRSCGIQTVMLTGDREKTARAVAADLGIDTFRAELLPAQKAEIISSLQKQGHHVVMVGDGVNDSVSLALANTGIGLAGASDIAVSSCDVVLLKENLMDVDNARQISRRTMITIRENLFWAFIYNIVFIPVAAGVLYPSLGLKLTPMMASALMSLSSICVVLNAVRLSFVKLNTLTDRKGAQKNMRKKIDIKGMHCEHCVASVEKNLKALPGVTEVKVSLEDNQAIVSVSEAISDEMLKSVVENAGFKAVGVSLC